MTHSALLARFRARTPREQALLAAVALILGIYALWFVLLQPLLQARDVASRRVLQAEESLLMVAELASALRAARETASTQGTHGNLAQWLDQSAIQQGLVIASLEPAPDNQSVSLRLESANMTEVLAWLLSLERSGWVAIESLAVTPTRAQGEVSVSMRARSW